MRILITGICGFVGRHLANYLLGEGKNQILGIDYKIGGFNNSKPTSKVEILEADISDRQKVENIIEKFKPQQLYHLAAISSVSYSWENPIETFKVNVFGGINILESVRKFCPECKTLIVCTAEEYDEIKNVDNRPVDEDFKICPTNPYAISKSALDFLSATYNRAYSLFIFITRPFNHIGPGQSERFVISDFARQVAKIEKNLMPPVIKVGNIDNFRDFLDVRDVVRAYHFIIERGRAGDVYNVCSGEKYKISDLLKILISFSKRDDIKIKTDKNKLRPVDVTIMYGDNSKLKSDTGWKPYYKIEDSLIDILNYWRNIINKKRSY